MKFWPSLSLKISLLAFLNVALLALVLFIFAHLQFRVDLGSFLFAPAQDRMLSVSRLLALQLPEEPAAKWSESLARFSKMYSAQLYLFSDHGEQLGGSDVILPNDIKLLLIHGHNTRQPGRSDRLHMPLRLGPPPLFVGRLHRAGEYWVGVPIPIWSATRNEPIHGAVIWRFSSIWTNPFFFDYRPWLAFIVAIVFISVACWLPLIRGLTKTIVQIRRVTGQIAEGHFETSLSTRRRDELGQLSQSINRMSRRLADLVHGQRRFLSDIAHELCSPVARMQVALAILERRIGDNTIEYVRDVSEELTHVSNLINELLSFSRAAMGPVKTQVTRVNVADVAQQVLEREGSDEVEIEIDIGKNVHVIAQPEYLHRSLANLVRNAIRYAASGGLIRVSAENGKGVVSIRVADHGPGLPPTELEHVFKPFYRPELARQRETGGAGLGLAIVKSCVEACGGVVSCQNRMPHGLVVEMILPAASSKPL